MADADADAAKIGAEAGADRAQAVVAGSAAADLHLDLHRGEVELVVKGGQGVDVELVEVKRLLNRVAADVHVGLGLEQQQLVAADAALARQAAEFLLPGAEAMHRGDGVDGHEADVVPVERILRARIAKACPDLHRRRACQQKRPPRKRDGRPCSKRWEEAQASSPPSASPPSPSASSSPTTGTAPSGASS